MVFTVKVLEVFPPQYKYVQPYIPQILAIDIDTSAYLRACGRDVFSGPFANSEEAPCLSLPDAHPRFLDASPTRTITPGQNQQNKASVHAGR